MCKTRKTSATTVVVFSAISGLCGFLAILAGFGAFNAPTPAEHDATKVQQLAGTIQGGGAIMHSHAVLILILSVLGCATYKIKNKCFIMVFGIVLGLVWIACVVTGFIFSAAAIGAPILANGICASSVDGYLGFGPKMILNNYMCTRACPCVPASQNTFNQLNATYFNNFNRTKDAGAGYDANGYLKMYYESNSGNVQFSKFSDCWTTRLQTRNNSDGTPFFNATFSNQMNGFLKVMGMMEEQFACSGICQPNLFWYTRPSTNPAPQIRCLDRMTDIVTTKFMMPGLCILAGGFFLLLTWIFQYCLWCKKDDE